MGATGHNDKEQQTAADPEIFVVCVCVCVGGWVGSSSFIFYRGGGGQTNILSGPFHNQNCLGQFCEIQGNQIKDEHRGSTLITRMIT